MVYVKILFAVAAPVVGMSAIAAAVCCDNIAVVAALGSGAWALLGLWGLLCVADGGDPWMYA